MKTALIIGHPGHELRAFAFMLKYKPDVYILTDGSGSKNESRLYQSIKVIESIGAKFIDSSHTFTDKELYEIILSKDLTKIKAYKNELISSCLENDYDMIVGDELEGFNPTHDLCRYLINGIDIYFNNKKDKKILNYGFLLDSIPDEKAFKNSNNLIIKLTEEEFEMKNDVALNYPELKFEVDYAIEKFGKEVFSIEVFNKINDPLVIKNWNQSKPHYELFGEKRLNEGVYKNVIRFEEHISPIANFILKLD